MTMKPSLVNPQKPFPHHAHAPLSLATMLTTDPPPVEAQRAHTEKVNKLQGRIIPKVFHRGKAVKDFRGAWKKACEAAGVPGRIFHDFRRTAVRNLERAGVSRSVAMLMTGHKTEAIYRRYAIVSEADLHVAARQLDAVTGESKGENLGLGTNLGTITSIYGSQRSADRTKMAESQ